jgi:hypothetical protein
MRSLLFLLFILSTSTLRAQTEGIIIDKYGQRFSGLLTITTGAKTKPDLLAFRETAKSKKETLTVDDLRAFAIGQDSFLMLRKFKFPLLDTPYDRFVKVVLRGQDDLLCTFRAPRDDPKEVSTYHNPVTLNGVGKTTFTPKTITHYITQRKGEFLLITDFNFYHEMPNVVADYTTLKDQIVSKKLTFEDMEGIIEAYESWRKRGRI